MHAAPTSVLPVLPTMGVGSTAVPGWFGFLRRQLREGAFGAADVEEMLDDGLRLVVADQIEAGLDILSDGEIRRQRFVFEMYDRLTGLRRLDSQRRLGVPGYDQAPKFEVSGTVEAPHGLGVVEDYLKLHALAPGRELKVALPGPLTFVDALLPHRRRSNETVLDDLVRVVRQEVELLVRAGARRIQIDEPGLAHPSHGLPLDTAAQLVNRCMEGLAARFGVHVCFGNNAGRPMAQRSIERLLPGIGQLQCEELVLEFANREMAEVELLARLSRSHHIAAGVVDVKSFYIETKDDVAQRIEKVLAHVPPARLTVTADCGFSALPRAVARAKMRSMVEGARLVRQRMGEG